MDIFLKKSDTISQEGPQIGGLLGGIPGESIVIIRGDSSMHVTAPEDLSVGQDVELKIVILMILTLGRLRLMSVFVLVFVFPF